MGHDRVCNAKSMLQTYWTVSASNVSEITRAFVSCPSFPFLSLERFTDRNIARVGIYGSFITASCALYMLHKIHWYTALEHDIDSRLNHGSFDILTPFELRYTHGTHGYKASTTLVEEQQLQKGCRKLPVEHLVRRRNFIFVHFSLDFQLNQLKLP